VSAATQPERRLLRDRSGGQRVTNMELFFDLVYVFAVTQLSHHLLAEPTVRGALQSALLLVMVWLVWAYTTWVTNWMDPARLEIRLVLVVLMLISLAMSAALPGAFGDLGIVVGGAYAVQQIGRSVFMVVVLRGPLQKNFERILAWCVVSGAFAVAGGLTRGAPRDAAWVLAVATDVSGGLTGFATPGLGRSRTRDWTIEGSHFAERCQAFILIALGESIVIIGATLSGEMTHVTGSNVAAFVVAFGGSVALWWLYFDRSADASMNIIASSKDPGRLGRSAYHLIHPVMVAGIIVWAAGDEKILTSPASTASGPSAWMILGGPVLFLAGHAAFKFVVWRVIPWTRLAGVAVLALLALAAASLPEIALAACTTAARVPASASSRLPPEGAGWLLFSFFRVGDDADAVVGEQERDVLEALGDREQQVGHGRAGVPAEHARSQPELRAVVRTDVFLELVKQVVVVHLPVPSACTHPVRIWAGLGILVQPGEPMAPQQQRAGPGGRSGPARGRLFSRSGGEVQQRLRARRVAQLGQRLLFQLADPLAGQPQRAADLVQRVRVPVVEPEPHGHDRRLTGRQRVQRRTELLRHQLTVDQLGGLRRVDILDQVADGRLAVLADRGVERDRLP
jgi:low temperature requirement protein LtrA